MSYCEADHRSNLFIPWGQDLTFTAGNIVYAKGMLTWRLYELPGWRSNYSDAMRDLLGNVWNETEILAEMERMEALIAPLAENDFVVVEGKSTFSESIEQVREFVTGRRAAFEARLDDLPNLSMGPESEKCVCHNDCFDNGRTLEDCNLECGKNLE
ncbi:MAG: hypothetical protein GY847_20690 [Proteobacteria bacterium]|nr:hypothetical protein [Pseudomonadota bacterium]